MQDLEWDDLSGLDEVERAKLDEALAPLLEPKPVLGRERLLRAVEPLPLRFAPLFSRIAALWDVSELDVEALLCRARNADAWRKPGLPGLSVVDVEGGAAVHGAEVHLVRFAPGMRFPAHRHPGPEALLVLEGSYRDSSGHWVRAGELHRMPPGSEHWFHVGKEGPCVAASVQYGREFTGALMKILTRLFG